MLKSHSAECGVHTIAACQHNRHTTTPFRKQYGVLAPSQRVSTIATQQLRFGSNMVYQHHRSVSAPSPHNNSVSEAVWWLFGRAPAAEGIAYKRQQSGIIDVPAFEDGLRHLL